MLDDVVELAIEAIGLGGQVIELGIELGQPPGPPTGPGPGADEAGLLDGGGPGQGAESVAAVGAHRTETEAEADRAEHGAHHCRRHGQVIAVGAEDVGDAGSLDVRAGHGEAVVPPSHGAIGADPGVEQARGQERGLQAGPVDGGDRWPEVDESPQGRTLARGGPVRSAPGERRIFVPFGGHLGPPAGHVGGLVPDGGDIGVEPVRCSTSRSRWGQTRSASTWPGDDAPGSPTTSMASASWARPVTSSQVVPSAHAARSCRQAARA